MATNQEIIEGILQFYDVETLELQVRYCQTVVRTATEETEARRSTDPANPAQRPLPLGPVNQCNKTLSLLAEARRLQRLLVAQATNAALGPDSPYHNNAYLQLHEDENIYERYCTLRLATNPRMAHPGKRSALHPIHRDVLGGERSPRGEAPRKAPDDSEYFEGIMKRAKERGIDPTIALALGGEDLGAEAMQAAEKMLATQRAEAGGAHDLELLTGTLDKWAQEARGWLDKADASLPLPELDPKVIDTLERQAQTNPGCAVWLETVQGLLGNAQAAQMRMLSQRIARPESERKQGKLLVGPGGTRPPTKA